jgi:hypothetical protein
VWLEIRATLLSAWCSVVAIIGVPLILIRGYASWIQVRQFLTRPEVVLQLASPKKLRFWLLNPAPAVNTTEGGIKNKKFDGYRPIGRAISSRTRHNVATNTKPERTIVVNCFT